MKRLTLIFFCVVVASRVLGQVAQLPPEFKNATLLERYQYMKSSSQTYQDYKVIKEINLDKEWRIMLDSVKAGYSRTRTAKAETAKVLAELNSAKLTLKQKQDLMVPTEHAASHINFIGIDFNKAAFTGMVIAVIGALVALILLVLGRLKMVNSDVKEKAEAFDRVTRELEDYKHKALEKQTKLSRELQNERNRLQEMRGSRV